MCTAITYRTKDFYFGRTLDYDCSFGEEIAVTPRRYPLCGMDTHYAMVGMALVAEGYPLYYDAINEKGLGVAGLNFVGNAVYHQPDPAREHVAQYDFVPWILSRCASVAEARALLTRTTVTGEAFHAKLPPAQLHWLIADRDEVITVESVREGLRVYPNPVGVLTNNPSFDEQLFQLNNYMHLSPRPPENRFSDRLQLVEYSRGMGALGLPGDWSSQSRFVRAAFARINAMSGDTETESVNQFFHILHTVEQPRGCCELGDGAHEITRYTACCNADRGIYYYTTYENHQITAVDMHRTALDGTRLSRYPLRRSEQIQWEN